MPSGFRTRAKLRLRSLVVDLIALGLECRHLLLAQDCFGGLHERFGAFLRATDALTLLDQRIHFGLLVGSQLQVGVGRRAIHLAFHGAATVILILWVVGKCGSDRKSHRRHQSHSSKFSHDEKIRHAPDRVVQFHAAVKVNLSPCVSTLMRWPSPNFPSRMSRLSGSRMYFWIARFNGRAP